MSDLDFVIQSLPKWYRVTVKKKKNGKEIHCCSTGTNKGMNEVEWEQFKHDCRKHFGHAIQEFYHNVSHQHQDFILYLNTGKSF